MHHKFFTCWLFLMSIIRPSISMEILPQEIFNFILQIYFNNLVEKEDINRLCQVSTGFYEGIKAIVPPEWYINIHRINSKKNKLLIYIALKNKTYNNRLTISRSNILNSLVKEENPDLELIEHALKHGVDPNNQNNNGNNPILWATRDGNLEVIKLLVKYKANPCLSYKRSPNSKLCMCDRNYCKVPNLPSPSWRGGASCLHWASFLGYIDIVKFFIDECNMSPFIQNKDGQTPLDLAILNNKTKVVEFLSSLNGL